MYNLSISIESSGRCCPRPPEDRPTAWLPCTSVSPTLSTSVSQDISPEGPQGVGGQSRSRGDRTRKISPFPCGCFRSPGPNPTASGRCSGTPSREASSHPEAGAEPSFYRPPCAPRAAAGSRVLAAWPWSSPAAGSARQGRVQLTPRHGRKRAGIWSRLPLIPATTDRSTRALVGDGGFQRLKHGHSGVPRAGGVWGRPVLGTKPGPTPHMSSRHRSAQRCTQSWVRPAGSSAGALRFLSVGNPWL